MSSVLLQAHKARIPIMMTARQGGCVDAKTITEARMTSGTTEMTRRAWTAVPHLEVMHHLPVLWPRDFEPPFAI